MEAISQGPMRNSAHFGLWPLGWSYVFQCVASPRSASVSAVRCQFLLSLYFLNAVAPLFGRREGAGTISLSKVIPVVAVSNIACLRGRDEGK